MKKSGRLILWTLLIVGLIATSGWAGTTQVNSGGANDPFYVGLETLGAARNVTITGVGGGAAGNAGAIQYTLTQNLSTGNLLTVTFADGLVFPGATQYLVCASNAGNSDSGGNIGAGTPGAGTTSYNFQIDKTGITTPDTDAGHIIWLTTGAGCSGAATNDMIFQVTTNAASAGLKNIGLQTKTSGGIVVDPESSVAAANVLSEFTGAVTTRDLTFDYLGTDSTDGTLFDSTVGDSGGMNNFASNTIALNLTIDATMDYRAAFGAQNAGLTVGGLINFDAATNWAGVNQVWATTSAAGCSAGSANANSNVENDPSGAEILTLATTAFDGGANAAVAGTNSIYICLGVDGVTPLTSRTIIGSYNIEVNSNNPDAVNATWQTWSPNGWQGYLPHMRFNDTTRTFVRIVNDNPNVANVFVDALQPDGTALTRVALDPIPARQTVTYSAAAIATAAGVVGDNYACLMTVTQEPTNVYANAFFNILSNGVWTTRNVTLYEERTPVTAGDAVMK